MPHRERIGRFEVEREAASGAIGTVFRARDPKGGQAVAIKVIRGMLDADLHRFSREARILSQIRHPGVVRYVEHGVGAPGEAYLVMEWLDGEDLRQRMARAGLSLAEVIALGLRVAESLAVVHAHGLVHRDIKPGNLFLPGGVVGDVKIIDFGLARGDDSAGPTQTGVVIGTPSYMSPEQARGERGIDARADLYSLGCVLFKALTGRVPFPGPELMAVLTKVLFEDAPRVHELRAGVPAALDDLVAGLLAKKRVDRPPSASVVAQVLAGLAGFAAIDDEPQPAPPSGSPSGLMIGEQRRVAMLLVGPEESVLDVDDSVAARVKEHGGRLDRLLDGTRVVAFAGGPAPATDQAARAARCALALRALLPTAPMVVTTCRSEVDRRLPVGAAVDRAAGMLRQSMEATVIEGKTPPGAIVVDEVTAALLDPRFDVRMEGGRLTLHAIREVTSGTRRVLGKETPFVGRDWELSSILGLFDRCAEDETALALLVAAPPGMGKSRLAREAVHALSRRRPEVTIWRGRGDPLRAGSALTLLSQILRGACGMREGEPLGDRRERLRRHASLHVGASDAPRVARFLGEIVGSPFLDDDAPDLRAARHDARIMGEQTRRAFCDFVAAERAAAPGLLVIEDLQWADPSTVRFLDDALQHASRQPWMVLALARPEVFDIYPRLWRDRNIQEIRLKPLPRRASERLVQEVLGDRAAGDTATRLAARADGNAFYLEELIRAVGSGPKPSVTEPAVRGFRRRSPTPDALPETILAMVQARIEALDPDHRRALRAGSIFGEVFWPGAVAALLGAGSGPPPGEGWVDTLADREVIVRRGESRYPGEEEVAFRHALLREGAYATLTERDRAIGHRLAAEWLEQHGESDPMLLARHLALGDDPARAGVFYLRAADQALRGADMDAARACAERALAVGIEGEPRHECLGILCEAHAWRAEWDLCSRYAAEVTKLAPEGSTPWLRGVTSMQAAAFGESRPLDLMQALFTLMGVDATPDAVPTVVRCLTVGLLVSSFMVQFAIVEGLLSRIDAIVAERSDDDRLSTGWMHLAHGFHDAWKTGALGSSLVHMETARRSFESVRDERSGQLAQVFTGMVHWNLGLFEEAERMLRSFVPAADEHLVAQARAFYLALSLIERGALDEAREIAHRRIEVAREQREGNAAVREAEGRWLLGEIAARAGDLGAAASSLGEAVPALRATPLTWQFVAVSLASVRLRQGRAGEAVVLAREVLAAVAAHGGTGHRPARARLVLAEALLASGDPAAADATLAGARAEILARAGEIADEDVRRRFLTALPEHARTLELAGERLGPAT